MAAATLWKIHHPVGACTAEEKKEFAEMNLTDHAGVRLTHGKPKVNGVEITTPSAALATRCSCGTARRRPCRTGATSCRC
jgi:hypothetical protein